MIPCAIWLECRKRVCYTLGEGKIRMFFSSKRDDKEQRRFYLLPGQGGQASRRKKNIILIWSIITGLIVSAILTALIYWLNHPSIN